MNHKHVWVKVNAPVDKGVSELVEALSQFPELRTTESCEGGGERGPRIWFEYGFQWIDPWERIAKFVLGYLGPGLAKLLGDRVSVSLQVTECGHVHGELYIGPGAEELTLDALSRLVQEYPD